MRSKILIHVPKKSKLIIDSQKNSIPLKYIQYDGKNFVFKSRHNEFYFKLNKNSATFNSCAKKSDIEEFIFEADKILSTNSYDIYGFCNVFKNEKHIIVCESMDIFIKNKGNYINLFQQLCK